MMFHKKKYCKTLEDIKFANLFNSIKKNSYILKSFFKQNYTLYALPYCEKITKIFKIILFFNTTVI